MKGQAIERGYLGVRIQALNEDLADSLGIPHRKGEFVQAIEPGKPAAAAGILPGDVVLKVNGLEVGPRPDAVVHRRQYRARCPHPDRADA